MKLDQSDQKTRDVGGGETEREGQRREGRGCCLMGPLGVGILSWEVRRGQWGGWEVRVGVSTPWCWELAEELSQGSTQGRFLSPAQGGPGSLGRRCTTLEAQISEVSGVQGPALPTPLPGQVDSPLGDQAGKMGSPSHLLVTATGQNEGTGWVLGCAGLWGPPGLLWAPGFSTKA